MVSASSIIGTGGISTPLQITLFGAITNLAAADFVLPDNRPFIICNDTDLPITLNVIPAASTTGDYVAKRFQPGDNAYLVRKIQSTALANTLLWGY